MFLRTILPSKLKRETTKQHVMWKTESWQPPHSDFEVPPIPCGGYHAHVHVMDIICETFMIDKCRFSVLFRDGAYPHTLMGKPTDAPFSSITSGPFSARQIGCPALGDNGATVLVGVNARPPDCNRRAAVQPLLRHGSPPQQNASAHRKRSTDADDTSPTAKLNQRTARKAANT